MKTLLKKVCIIFSMLMVLVAAYPKLEVPVLAAGTATVSISTKSAAVGDKVSVTVTASSSNNIIMCDLYLTYDPNILQAESGFNNGGGGKIRILSTDASSFTISFKTLVSGTSSVNLDTGMSIISSETEDRLAISGGKGSVKVSAPASYSSNNSLKSLTISPGTLSPAFSKDVTSYTASVDADCEKLVVSALAEDSGATVSVTGNKMDPGMNTTKITVKAQDGSSKVYTIKTTKAGKETQSQQESQTEKQSEAESSNASGDVRVTVNGQAYNVVSDFTNHMLPTGYTQGNIDFQGKQIAVGKSVNGITIVYLEKADGSGEGGFYVYDTTTDTFTLLTSVSQPVVLYTILPITNNMELPDGYTKTTYQINGNTVDVLVKDSSNTQYCLFYGSNSDGNVAWYRYDYQEKTVQRYIADDVAATKGSTGSFAEIWNNGGKIYTIIAGSAVGVLLLIVIIQAIILKKKDGQLESDLDQDTEEYDDDQYYDGDHNYYEDALADENDEENSPIDVNAAVTINSDNNGMEDGMLESQKKNKEQTDDDLEPSYLSEDILQDEEISEDILQDEEISEDILQDEEISVDILQDEEISEDILQDEEESEDVLQNEASDEGAFQDEITQNEPQDNDQPDMGLGNEEMEYIQRILKTDVLTDFEDHAELFQNSYTTKVEDHKENKTDSDTLGQGNKNPQNVEKNTENIEVELFEIENDKQ